MKVTVQVVTISDDGQESIREVACVERQDLTPATLGLSLAEGKTILQALQEVVVEWQMHAYLGQQRSLSAVRQAAPQQRGRITRSFGPSLATSRSKVPVSPIVPVRPMTPQSFSPLADAACRSAPPRSCSIWKPNGPPCRRMA